MVASRAVRWVAAAAALGMLVAGCSADDDVAGAPGDGAVTSTTGDAAGGPTTTRAPAPLPDAIASFSSATYADPINWVCRADVDDDACDTDLTAASTTVDGTTGTIEPEPAAAEAVDCFYIYPTVNFEGSRDDAMSADMTAELNVVNAQLAPFGEACRLWAPLYRQLTLAGFGNPEDREVAYGDVRGAFFHWLANDSDGRPFVLLGHSQGSGHLQRLIAEEVADEPAVRDRLVSALLLGGRIDTPQGDPTDSNTGLPLCAATDDTGCVIAFNTVSPVATTADVERWGSAPDGRQRACTNPVDPGAPADAWLPANTRIPINPDDPDLFDVDTPYGALLGVVEVRCTERDGATVLEARQADAWQGGDVSRLTTDVPGWGLHIVEVNLVAGSLVELVASQIEAYQAN